MICGDFTSFRARFATRAIMSMPQTFDFTAPDQIDSNGVNWGSLTPPFVAGMTLIMNGSASGNDTFTIDSIASDIVTTVEQTVVNEATVTMSLCEGVTFDESGWEQWPVEYMRVGDTGAPFADGIEGFAADPWTGDTIILTCNGATPDAVYRTDEYDWYLSQRTDDSTKQYLEIVQAGDDIGPVSYSGGVLITPTALAYTKFGFSAGSPVDPDIVRMLFKGCHLYVRRISDQAIQMTDMLLKVTGN